MKLGLRGRILLSFVLLLLVSVLWSVWLQGRVRRWLVVQATASTIQLARTSALNLASHQAKDTDYAKLASGLCRSSGVPVQFVGSDGSLIASACGREGKHQREPQNLRSATDITQALGQGVGVARLDDEGADGAIAVSVRIHAGAAVVRLVRPLDDVGAKMRKFTSWIVGVWLVMSLLLVGVSALLSRHLRKSGWKLFSEFIDVVNSPQVEGELGDGQAFEKLAGSVNAMARKFAATVAETTRTRDRFVAVLDSMDDAVVATDEHGLVTLCNRAARRLFGWEQSPMGRPFEELVSGEMRSSIVDMMCTVGTQKQDKELLLSKLADTRMLVRTVSLASGEGGSLFVLRDVTALRRLENMRRDFVANVSHELRTPVTTILAAAENLQAGAIRDPKHAERFVGAVVRNAERLSRIIADLLDLSRVESGELDVDLQPVLVATAVHRAVEGVESIALEKEISLDVQVDPPLTVLADEKALDQVLLNLLSNAVKYTHVGGAVRVVAGRRPGEQVRIEVQDNGSGIAEEHRGRIFERFYRVDPGRSRDLGGTGLGLAIVRHLVSAMNGRVGVTQAEPQGAVFWVELSEPGLGSERSED